MNPAEADFLMLMPSSTKVPKLANQNQLTVAINIVVEP